VITVALWGGLTVAASYITVLAGKQFFIRMVYKAAAMIEASRLVQAEGDLMDEPVGHGQFCDMLMNNLQDRKVRRSHVIVGGVGAGKTALLVQLTRRLAAIGAIPIPIRLDDIQHKEELDFSDLARKRFSEIVAPVVGSEAELDRTWRWLRDHTDRVVVLADGLEQAFSDKSMAGHRDHLIRAAIRKANSQGLPLVIASRPHVSLRAMQATVTWLDPLSDEAALRYISRGGSWRSDPALLDRVVEIAKVVESPLYLQIAKDLHRKDLLEPLWAGINAGNLAVQDRWTFRQDLLHTWLNTLIDGKSRPELAIDTDTRQAVVEYVSALACIGLASDSSRVALRDLDQALKGLHDGKRDDVNQKDDSKWNDRVASYLDQKMSALQAPVDGTNKQAPLSPSIGNAHVDFVTSSKKDKKLSPGPYMDVWLAATWATQMGLVQESGATDSDGGSTIHFQHSIIQAYLGSRFLAAILGAEEPQTTGHNHSYSPRTSLSRTPSTSAPGKPSREELTTSTPTSIQTKLLLSALHHLKRELLIALVLHSRSLDGRCTCAEGDETKDRPCPTDLMRRVVKKAASDSLDAGEKAEGGLSLWALECFGAAMEIASGDSNPRLKELVPQQDQWRRIGEGNDPAWLRQPKIAMIRQCGEAARRAIRIDGDGSIYRAMFDIGCIESDSQVRSEIATQVGTGGMDAFSALHDVISSRERIIKSDRPPDRSKVKPNTQVPGDRRSPTPRFQDERQRNAWLQEDQRQRQREQRKRADEEAQGERDRWYHSSMWAWLLPMLVDSAAMTGHSGSPWYELESLISDVTKGTELRWAVGPSGEAPVPTGERYGLGLALAQGFKYAANRRLSPQSNQAGREFLIKQAEELLKQSTFWYTRLTLLQALTLWALPDDVTGPHRIRGKGADPEDQVKGWLARPADQKEHPLVKAGGKLAVRALQTRRPERFLWIDDADMASRIGTEVSAPGAPGFHNLWIPPSTGWSSLDPAAQQLLADVLLLVVLGERGYRPKDLFRVLERVSESPKLPSCLNKDRSRLDPVRAVDALAQPGDNCADDCGMKMCPYPGKAEKGLKLEFNEIFCSHQRDMLRAWQPRSWRYLRFRRESVWQRKVPVAGMRRFWDEMGERARDVSREEAATARTQVRA
jgi:predicted ATPase